MDLDFEMFVNDEQEHDQSSDKLLDDDEIVKMVCIKDYVLEPSDNREDKSTLYDINVINNFINFLYILDQ